MRNFDTVSEWYSVPGICTDRLKSKHLEALERRAPVQVVAHQRGNSNQEVTDKNATEHINLGTTACKINP